MFPHPDKPTGTNIEGHWNDLPTIERLKMILDHRDLFVSLGLVTPMEIAMVAVTSESEWEYVIDREDQPLFKKINIKKEMDTQILRDRLQAALRAAFFLSEHF